MVWLRVQLTEEEQSIVNEERTSHPHERIRERMLVLWLLHKGVTRQKAAEIVGVGRATVQRYVAAFRDGGLDGLRRWDPNRPESEMAAYRALIRESFEKQPVRTVAEACDRIFQLTGLRRGPSQVRKFLKNMGLKFQRVRMVPVPPKKLGRARRNSGQVSRNRLETGSGCRCGGPRSCVLRRRGPFRVWDVLVLLVVICKTLHSFGFGSSALQRARSVERGDPRPDHCHQHHRRQHRDDVRVAAKDRRVGSHRTDHTGARQRALSTQHRGPGAGEGTGGHAPLSAVLLAEPEPDRTLVEIHQTSRALRPLPPDVRRLSSRDPRNSRRPFHHTRRASEDVDDTQLPAI